jgi:hypothetical protein
MITRSISSSEEISCTSWNQTVHYRIMKIPLLVSIHSHTAVQFIPSHSSCLRSCWMRYAVFCDVTQRWWVVSFRRYWTIYMFCLQGSSILKIIWIAWALEMGRIVCPETSVDYNYTLRDIPEYRISHSHRLWNLIFELFFFRKSVEKNSSFIKTWQE